MCQKHLAVVLSQTVYESLQLLLLMHSRTATNKSVKWVCNLRVLVLVCDAVSSKLLSSQQCAIQKTLMYVCMCILIIFVMHSWHATVI